MLLFHSVLRYGQELVRVHTRLIGPILAVDDEFHQQVHQLPDVVEHANATLKNR